MCLNTWTFKPINVDKINCKNCVLRWMWTAEHLSKVNPELFENCIDVVIDRPSSGSKVDDIQTPPNVAMTLDSAEDNQAIVALQAQSSQPEVEPKNTERVKTDNPAPQVAEANSAPVSSECACDLALDDPVYSQCTADGHYCSCFTGYWASIPSIKRICPAGTSCKQSGFTIFCN